MKKYILLVILFSVAASYVYLRLDAPKEKPLILRVGVECDHAPYNWEEDTKTDANFPLANKLGYYTDGYDVQMAALVAEKLGAKVVFIQLNFNDLIKALNRKEIDAIFSGMVDTEERWKVISFSTPYEVRKVEYAVLLSHQSKYAHTTKTLQDLEGARILAQKDSRFDEVVDQIPGVIHIPPADTQAEILEKLLNFEVDGTVINYDTGLSYERTNKNLIVVKFSENEGFHLGFNGLCAGVRKSDEKLLNDINDAINDIPMKQRQKVMDKAISRVWENL